MARIETTDKAAAAPTTPPTVQVTSPDGTKVQKKEKARPAWIKTYLILYNVYSTLAWLYPLVLTILHLSGITQQKLLASTPEFVRKMNIGGGLPPVSLGYGPYHPIQNYPWAPLWLQHVFERSETTFALIGEEVKFIQTCALLEVVHSALGWVRSPLSTTIAQVTSRLILVWGIADRFPSTHSNPLYTTMTLAWSITEVIRYAYYAFNVAGYEPYPLLWLRYTTFYVLYPIGAGSEAFLMFSTLPISYPPVPKDLLTWGLWDFVRLGLYTLWWPGLYSLYTYMMGQRRKVLGGGASKTKKTKVA